MRAGKTTIEAVICVGMATAMAGSLGGAILYSQSGMTAEKAKAEYDSEVAKLEPLIGAYRAAQAQRSPSLMNRAQDEYQGQLDRCMKARKRCEAYGVKVD